MAFTAEEIREDLAQIRARHHIADSSAAADIFLASKQEKLPIVVDIGRLGLAAQYVRLNCTECAHTLTCSGSTCRRMN